MRFRVFLKGAVSPTCLVVAVGSTCFSGAAFAACTVDASGNATCSGATTTPLTIYDPAAGVQPTNGSNAYTPTSYNQNPPTVYVSIVPGATFSITTNSTAALADRGVIAANYSNAENPAVNNVVLNNAGTVSIATSQISAGRVHAIVSDSQVNSFTVNNTGTITATQSFFTTFNSALLNATGSGTPPTYTPKYNGTTLPIVSALYSDDNTNEFAVNNAAGATLTATGRFAAAYYGRADTTIVNSGTFGNVTWAATDKIYDGHWAVGTYAGADFATVANSNPDTPLYMVQNITTNAQGFKQGTLAVTDTSATTITNNAGGIIRGDVLVLDTNPLVTAAATASGQALPLAGSGSNSGPRDSNIQNYGAISGNFYLGSGTHVIDNAAGATITGSVNVNQAASVGTFAVGVAGTAAGTYQSAGPATMSSTGAACPTAGANTADPYCAATTNVLASFVGGQQLTLTNEGTLTGNIVINDQAGSVNNITLTGTGFSGNVVATNGVGTNNLTLSGVTNLASVQNFSSLDLTTSHVTVANGVSLVSGATLATTISGAGGTLAAPSTTGAGMITGTLTAAGPTTLAPTFGTIVHTGVYEIATAVAGPGTFTSLGTALVPTTAVVQNGQLLLSAQVRNANTFAGITPSGAAAVNGLLAYSGANANLQNLGLTLENFSTDAAVARAGRALSPAVNGADVQIPINSVMLFHQQIDARLDSFLSAQIPVSGRSADLGVARPVPIYGALPPNGAWIEAIDGAVHQGSVAGTAGYQASLQGVIGGYDRLVLPNVRVGGAFGFIDGTTNSSVNLSGNHDNVQTYQGLGYAAYEGERTYLRGSAGYGGVKFSDTRQIAFPGFADTAVSSHGGNVLTLRGEGGVPYEYRNSLLVPYAAFTYSRLSQNAYAETSGSGAGLAYQGVTNNSERSEVGGKVIMPIATLPAFSTLFPVGSAVALEGRGAYVHEFGNAAQTVTASFVGAGNVFVAPGPNPSRDMFDGGVGIRVSDGAAVMDVSYNALARSNYLQQVGMLRARYLF